MATLSCRIPITLHNAGNKCTTTLLARVLSALVTDMSELFSGPVDLRDVFGLERFCQILIERLPRLDIVVNNVCQTVRRPLIAI